MLLGHGALLIMPLIFPAAKTFLLRYRLFLYYQWFFQDIEKGWRKYIFNFRHFEKLRK